MTRVQSKSVCLMSVGCPRQGRFTTVDPIRDGTNWYGYVTNDPLNLIDRYGLETEDRYHTFNPNDPMYSGGLTPTNDLFHLFAGGGLLRNIINRFTQRKTSIDITRRPKGVPNDWVPVPSKKGGGMRWIDPNNPHNQVRVMPGNPNSQFPDQRQPYVKQNRGGTYIDRFGNPVSSNGPEAHIPYNQYQFVP